MDNENTYDCGNPGNGGNNYIAVCYSIDGSKYSGRRTWPFIQVKKISSSKIKYSNS